MAECTFQPRINAISRAATPHYDFANPENLIGQITQEAELKNMRIQQQKRQNEYMEHQQIMDGKEKLGIIDPKIYDAVKPRGSEIMLSRTKHIQEQQAEQQLRIEQAFGTAKSQRILVPTLIQPFNLTQQKKKLEESQVTKKQSAYLSAKDIVATILRNDV